jgi:hypothetical protein
MTREQRIAIENHCRLAAETVQDRFRSVGLVTSVIVTVNSGYE